MNADELKEVKQKIEQAKAEKAKAEGAMEAILKRWKDEFGCDSIDDAMGRIQELRETIRTLIEKYEKYMEELRKLIDD